MRTSEVSRHYARVLLETAIEADDDLDALATGLDAVAESLAESPELAAALGSPGIPRARRAKLGQALGERAAPGSRIGRFVSVMVQRERAGKIRETAAAFRAALDQHRGIVEAEVVSARPLDEASRAAVGKALEQTLSGTPRLRFLEDPSLLGGLVVRTGDRIFDASVSGELERFDRRHGVDSH